MNIKDIGSKLKETMIPKDVRKEEFELTDNERKEIVEEADMNSEQRPISDEVEDMEEPVQQKPMKIKTILVKSEDQEDEGTTKEKVKNTLKVVAGVGAIAVAGIAAVLLSSRKKR